MSKVHIHIHKTKDEASESDLISLLSLLNQRLNGHLTAASRSELEQKRIRTKNRLEVIKKEKQANAKDAGGKVESAKINEARRLALEISNLLGQPRMRETEADDFEQGLKGLRTALNWFK